MKKINLPKSLGTIPSWFRGFSLGCLLLAMGAYYDQFTNIFRKAIMICLECIGIG